MSDPTAAPAPAQQTVDPKQFLTAAELEALNADYDDTLSEEPVNKHDEVHEEIPADPEPAAKPEAKAEPAKEEAKPAEASAPESAPAKEEPKAEPAKPEAVTQPPSAAPLLVVTAPEDAAEKLAAIEKDKDYLATQFDDGEITGAEFQKKLDALNKQERKIELAVNNAEMAQQLQVQQAKNLWDAECKSFFARPETKVYEAKPELFTQLNDTVIAISQVPRNKGLTGTQILEKAHIMLKAEMADQFDAAPAPAEAKPAEKSVPKPRAELPPTIGGLPAADVTTASGGKYDSLNRLMTTDPIEYQKQVAKMSEAERMAYLRD